MTLAQQTYDRTKQLTEHEFASVQKLDEATASLDVAKRSAEQAKLAYDEAVAGYTIEERGVAKAAVAKAEAAIATLEAQVAEMTVKAPIAAQVYQTATEPGEYVSPGVPLLSLIDLDDVWLRFDLREDLVKGLKIGDRFAVKIPALGDTPVTVEVRKIATRGEYAGWRATRATGDFDLRTFEVRAYPVDKIAEAATGHERLCRLDRSTLMPTAPRPGILSVAVREVIWIWRDKVALLVVVGVPLLAFALLAATFSNAVIRDLQGRRRRPGPVADVDDFRAGDQFGARRCRSAALVRPQRGHARGSLGRRPSPRSTSHEHLERDIMGGRRPQIVIFYNKQFFTPGNVASGALQAAISAARPISPAVGQSSATFTPGPLVRRAICPHQSRPQLCAVPAAGDPANGASHRYCHRRRLCRWI